MAPDEIFVLVVILVCVGGLALMEIRSRRRNRLATSQAEELKATQTEPALAPEQKKERRKRR
jgi:hypothetical protein